MCPLFMSSIALAICGVGSTGIAGALVARTLARITSQANPQPSEKKESRP
jgi:hypothetical protein